MTGFGAMVDEHRQMERCFIEAGEFQICVSRRLFTFVSRQRGLVAALEFSTDSRPPYRFIDADEAPRLAVSHRWGQTSGIEQTVESARFQGFREKSPHIATPPEKIQQPLAKTIAEVRHPLAAVPFETG